jgi:LPS-assembly protein
VDWLGASAMQTIEPRLFYLFTPYEDQSEHPVFDTNELDFSYSSLFRENRFTGRDRIGDANQLTAALTTRVIDQQNGRSLVDFSIGQIFYFRDLRVGLSGQPDSDRNRSATVAELNWRPAQAIIASAGLEWDSEADETRVAQFGLSYRPQRGVQLALGYRFRRERVDQADVRFRLPVRDNLALIGRANYSFEDDEPLELLAGIEYESCCWAVRLIGRDYVRDRDAQRRTAVFVELHLKGLGSLGRRPYPLFADVRY